MTLEFSDRPPRRKLTIGALAGFRPDRPASSQAGQLGIRPLRISTGEEEKAHASTEEKQIAFHRLLFPSHICLGPIWEDSGRTRTGKHERQKISGARELLPAVRENVCKNVWVRHGYTTGCSGRATVRVEPTADHDYRNGMPY